MAHGGIKNVQGYKDHGKRHLNKDKSRRIQDKRSQDKRRVSSMEFTRQAQDELEALIQHQLEHPAIGETEGAKYQRDLAERQKIYDAAKARENEEKQQTVLKAVPDLPEFEPVVEVEAERVYVKIVNKIDTTELPVLGDGNWRFSYQTARIMLKDGYNIKHVIKYTGIGYEDLADIQLDEEGYATSSGDEDGSD